MAVPEQEIWQGLLKASKFQTLEWRDDIRDRAGLDPRADSPARYMAMCRNLRPLSEWDAAVLDTGDLHPVSANEFIAKEGEITGANGLLRLINKFPISLGDPKQITLVGAISPNSLYSTLTWCASEGWNDAHVTLIDKSLIPIETLRLMQEGGYFNWQGGVSLIEGDVTKFTPERQPDIVIADILSSWMVEPYHASLLHCRSPFEEFEKFLAWGSKTVTNHGWFFSRCMVAPENGTNTDPNLRSAVAAKERTDRIVEQLGDLAGRIDRDEVEATVEQLFDKPHPTSYCGLEKVSPIFRSHKTLKGSHAERVLQRVHQRNFDTSHQITVRDAKSEYTFLNFACQG